MSSPNSHDVANLIELAATWCEGEAKNNSHEGLKHIWNHRAKMLREGYRPLLVQARSGPERDGAIDVAIANFVRMPVDAAFTATQVADILSEIADEYTAPQADRDKDVPVEASPAEPVSEAGKRDAKDAARYRWLRDNSEEAPVQLILDTGFFGADVPQGERIDAAIDVAIGMQQPDATEEHGK